MLRVRPGELKQWHCKKKKKKKTTKQNTIINERHDLRLCSTQARRHTLFGIADRVAVLDICFNHNDAL